MTVRIGVHLEWDDKLLLENMRNGQRKLAYAVVNAINLASLDVEKAEFESVAAKFTIRKPNLFFGTPTGPGGVAAKLGPRASVGKQKPFREVYVADKTASTTEAGGLKRGPTLLAIFEAGGARAPVA